MRKRCRCGHCIMPPHILRKLIESKNPELRAAALNTMLSTERLRGERSIRALATLATAPADGRRTIYDCRQSTNLASSVLSRAEGGQPVADATVNRAYDGFGATRDFYAKVLDRNSADGKGAPLNGYVHRGVKFNNAFWDGQEMIFGDGDGIVLTDLTKSLDVIAHELTHGVTDNAAGLEYHTQSGALNESISDVFGSLVKQWSLNQTADQADWLIGADVWTPAVQGDALRSLKNPGSAYDDPELGTDPQPDHIGKYVRLPDNEDGDNGGVHINSGIPNKAFYLAATGIGGHAWEAAGRIWYESLLASGATTQFQDFADTTFMKAGQIYGPSSAQQSAVRDAWDGVGIRVGGTASAVAGATMAGGDLAPLVASIDALSKKIAVLATDVETLKPRKT